MQSNIKNNFIKIGVLLLLASIPLGAIADCFHDASLRYGPPEKLLRAIARVESFNRSYAINYNKDGSYDIGVMQINSRWIPRLRKWDIDQNALMNACTNINVGAWILAQNIQRFGYNWEAVGAYNASSHVKRYIYAYRVSNALAQLN